MADEQQQEVTEQQEEVMETPQQETDPKQGDDPAPPEWGISSSWKVFLAEPFWLRPSGGTSWWFPAVIFTNQLLC